MIKNNRDIRSLSVREAGGGIKPGVSAANPGNTRENPIESAKRTAAVK